MSQLYVTSQFDELDHICWRYYGRTQQTVEAVLLANPGLADMLPILPEGLQILLPDLPEPSTTETVRIWDQLPTAASGTGAA
jgi:phage tail protein X